MVMVNGGPGSESEAPQDADAPSNWNFDEGEITDGTGTVLSKAVAEVVEDPEPVIEQARQQEKLWGPEFHNPSNPPGRPDLPLEETEDFSPRCLAMLQARAERAQEQGRVSQYLRPDYAMLLGRIVSIMHGHFSEEISDRRQLNGDSCIGFLQAAYLSKNPGETDTSSEIGLEHICSADFLPVAEGRRRGNAVMQVLDAALRATAESPNYFKVRHPISRTSSISGKEDLPLFDFSVEVALDPGEYRIKFSYLCYADIEEKVESALRYTRQFEVMRKVMTAAMALAGRPLDDDSLLSKILCYFNEESMCKSEHHLFAEGGKADAIYELTATLRMSPEETVIFFEDTTGFVRNALACKRKNDAACLEYLQAEGHAKHTLARVSGPTLPVASPNVPVNDFDVSTSTEDNGAGKRYFVEFMKKYQ
jgi:hypothetical protein